MRADQVLELGVVESRDQRGVPFAIYAEFRDLQFMGVILQLPGPLPAGLFLGPAAATGSASGVRQPTGAGWRRIRLRSTARPNRETIQMRPSRTRVSPTMSIPVSMMSVQTSPGYS